MTARQGLRILSAFPAVNPDDFGLIAGEFIPKQKKERKKSCGVNVSEELVSSFLTRFQAVPGSFGKESGLTCPKKRLKDIYGEVD